MPNRGRGFGGLWNLIAEDRSLRRILTIVVTLLTVIIGIASLAIWPALIQLSQIDTGYADYARFLIIAGGMAAGIDLVLSFLLAWFDRTYSFLENVLTTYLIAFIILAICAFWNSPPLISFIYFSER